MSDVRMPPVSCKYGAPMGRPPWPRAYSGFAQGIDLTKTECFVKKARCFRVRLNSGGYDNGGAYWGTGQPLWCATNGFDDDDTFQMFTRAPNRDAAIKDFESTVAGNPAIKLTWATPPKLRLAERRSPWPQPPDRPDKWAET